MKISINYSTPEENVLEIGFYRGETLLHNVFYDIGGLSEEDLLELKKEAVAKFCACFPEIPLKSVMKGFGEVDPMMQKMYAETFNPKGAGRKTGKKIGKIKPETVIFYRRVTPEQKEILEKTLNELKKKSDS